MTKHEELRVAVAEAISYRRVWNHNRTAALLMLPSETNSPPDEMAPADAPLHPCVFEKIPALTLDAIQAATKGFPLWRHTALAAALSFRAGFMAMHVHQLSAADWAGCFLMAMKATQVEFGRELGGPVRYYTCPTCKGEFVQPNVGYQGQCKACQNTKTETP